MSPSRRFFTASRTRPQPSARRGVREPRDLGLFDQLAEHRQPLTGQSPLLTVQETATFLRTSIWSVYREIHDHDLPVRRRKRFIRIDQRELEDWQRRQWQRKPQSLQVVGGRR